MVQIHKTVMLEFRREVVMTILASFEENKLPKLLVLQRNVASNMKLDTKNHILLKGTSKYCRYKHYRGRSIYLYQKCNVALHPDCFKDYHSRNTKFIVFFSTRKCYQCKPSLYFEKYLVIFLSYH